MELDARVAWLLGLALTCLGPGCGADGADGAKGADAPVVPASLAFATPATLSTGRTASVYLVGEGTSFDGSSVVTMGDGITVDTCMPVSATALAVTVTTGAYAAVGPRTVTVTTGAQVLTLVGGVRVEPSLSGTVIWGSLSQGGFGRVRLKLAAGRIFETSVSGSVLVVGNAGYYASAGVKVLANRWISSDTADLSLEVSPFSGTDAILNVLFDDGVYEYPVSLPISLNPAALLVLGTSAAGTVQGDGRASLYAVEVPTAPHSLSINVEPAPGALLRPRIRIYRPGMGGPIVDTVGSSSGASASVNLDNPGTYLVSVADAFNAGGLANFDFVIAAD